MVSSDDEPLVPRSGNVVASTGSTVPASTGALVNAGIDDSQFIRNVVARVDERSRHVEPTQWESGAEFSLGSRPIEFQSQSQSDIVPSPRRHVQNSTEESQVGLVEAEAASQGVECGRIAVFAEAEAVDNRQPFLGGLQDESVVTLPASASNTGGAQVVCIADDSDDQQSNHTSDTESVDAYPSRRRLRLMWDPNLDMQRQAWHPGARSVESLFRELVSRIGSVPEGAPIPRPLRQQRWSPVIVPILRAAAGSSESAPAAFDFLMSLTSRIRDPVEFHDNRLTAVDALRTGWVSLRAVLRTWGIQEREHLTAHLRRQGFPATQPGNHISARAQEPLLSEACQVDARVALVEVVCMNVAICLGQELVVPEVARPHHEGIPVRHQRQREAAQESSWHQLDQLNLEDCFLTKVPTLRKCPHFLRGRLREVFSFALGERCRAKMDNDVEGDVCSWKLFGLIPAMLLHRPKGAGFVGRAELVHRFNDFQQGHWEQLWHRAQAAASARFSRASTSGATEEEDHRRRGRAAQSRVQQGQVSRARQELTGAPLVPRNEDTLQQLRWWQE